MIEQPEKPSWYLEARREVAEVFARSLPVDSETHDSPSGQYRLEVTSYSTGPDTWSYSRGRVIARSDGRVIAQVDRNFDMFPFSWCEAHANGHSYLVCGEDYQCQTVIELDTGRRVDHVDPAAEHGTAFCWAAHYPSSDGHFIFVDGCIWAAPYELVLFDFSSPMAHPYREIRRWSVWKVEGFQPDGSFVFEYTEVVRRADDKPLRDLTDEEDAEIAAAPRYEDVVRERRYRVIWRSDSTEEVVAVD